jgi:hypothetical protein
MDKISALHKLALAALQKRKAALLSGLHLSPDLVRASYVRQYLTCGKKNCRCRRGLKHGPFSIWCNPRSRDHFPSDEAAAKLMYLALRSIMRGWKVPAQHWQAAMNQFAIVFG